MILHGTEHVWESAKCDFEDNVLPYLRMHGYDIGLASTEGDVLAQRIVEMYVLMYRSFDPMTLELLKCAINEWEKSHGS